jgi:putative ABC transport system permease protein
MPGIGATSMSVAGVTVTVTLIAPTTQIRTEPWHDPRYAIGLLGMVLGNAMTGVSVGLARLLSAAARERAAIEAHLSLGWLRQQLQQHPGP